MKALSLEFDGTVVTFSDDGWFNGTAAGARFKKRPAEWLRLPDTVRYLDALCRRTEVGKSHFVKTSRGGATERRKSTQGTWFHPKLGIAYARWLDPDFAIWCDEQIDRLIRVQPELVRALEAENGKLAERAKALDRIAAAEGVCCLTDAARTLGVRYPVLRQWLLANDWIFQRGQQYVGKTDAVKAGWLRNSSFVYAIDDEGRDRIRWQAMVTGSGIVQLGQSFDSIVNPLPPKQELRARAPKPVPHELSPDQREAIRKAVDAEARKALDELLARFSEPAPAPTNQTCGVFEIKDF